MKRLQSATSMVAIVTLLFTSSAFAQVSRDGMGKVLPVEMFTCSFRDGKDTDDLNGVIDRWNEHQDERNTEDYAAWVLTPYYFTPTQAFDMIWMGAYTDANAMGAGTDDWLANGGELSDAFAEVVDCNAHVLLNSAMYKSPVNDETPGSGIITMMDCELNEGHRYFDIRSAEIKWSEYLTANGSSAGFFHWTPVFGGGDSEFDYKVVFSYPNFTAMGADMENTNNGGGREASRDIFGNIDECDDARVYIARSVRSAQLR